jgi:hypothetical protein
MANLPRKSPRAPKVHGKGAVRYELPEGPKGPIQIQVDFSQAPPPQSYFYSDSVGLNIDSDLSMATLSFGQERAGGSERIDVVMPKMALLSGFWASATEIEPVVNKAILTLGAKPVERPKPETKTSAVFYGNMIHMSAGPYEASLDFYCLAPRDIHLARTQGTEMGLQPIVRILMSIVLAGSFFGLLRPHAERLAAPNKMDRQAGLGTR